jgi:hypothetical protein
MKSLFILSVLISSRLFSQDLPTHEFINPTGTYILKGEVKNNRIISTSGEIRIKLLDSAMLVICFYMTKGYPGYESASFLDTLVYDDNKAKYFPKKDSGCSIIFSFNYGTVEISQIYSDPQSGCGFARGVLASAVFEKSSNDKPVIQDLSAHGISQKR